MLSEPHRSWRDAQNFLVTWWCSEAGNVGTAKVTIVYHLPCIRVKGALVTVTWTQRQRQAHTGIKYGHLTCIRIAYCYNKPDFGGGERTAFCTFIEDLKVKAAGCGTGSGLFKDKS